MLLSEELGSSLRALPRPAVNGSVNVFYSTPSRYVDEKKKWRGSYEVRTDDISAIVIFLKDLKRPGMKSAMSIRANSVLKRRGTADGITTDDVIKELVNQVAVA